MTGPEGVVVSRARVVALNAALWTLVLGGGTVLGFLALPEHIRVLFTAGQIATVVGFLAVLMAAMWSVGLSYARADAAGLTFRNGLRTHRLGWDEVSGLRFISGDPWAYVLLPGDEERLPLMGVMRVDGARAADAVDAMRALQARHRAAR